MSTTRTSTSTPPSLVIRAASRTQRGPCDRYEYVRDLSLGSPKAEPGPNPRVLGPEHGAATRSRRVNGYPAKKPVLRGLRKMELIKGLSCGQVPGNVQIVGGDYVQNSTSTLTYFCNTGSRGNHVFNSRLLQLAVKSKSGRCGISADLTSALIARQELWRIVGFRRSIYFVPAFKVYTDPLLSFPGE